MVEEFHTVLSGWRFSSNAVYNSVSTMTYNYIALCTDKHGRYVIFRNGHDQIGCERQTPAADIHLPDLQYRRSTFRENSSRTHHHPAFSSPPSLSLLSPSPSRSMSSVPLANARLCTRSTPMGARARAYTSTRFNFLFQSDVTAIEFYSSMERFRPRGVNLCILEQERDYSRKHSLNIDL